MLDQSTNEFSRISLSENDQCASPYIVRTILPGNDMLLDSDDDLVNNARKDDGKPPGKSLLDHLHMVLILEDGTLQSIPRLHRLRERLKPFFFLCALQEKYGNIPLGRPPGRTARRPRAS